MLITNNFLSESKSCKIENDNIETDSLITDDYDELLCRHHRCMLEEQKDRK